MSLVEFCYFLTGEGLENVEVTFVHKLVFTFDSFLRMDYFSMERGVLLDSIMRESQNSVNNNITTTKREER